MGDQLIPQYLRDAAAALPDTAALILDGERELTFGAWAERADRFARGLLQRHGVRPGDRVALSYPGSGWTEYAVAYFGVLTAGAVAVLLPTGMTPADRARARRLHHAVLAVSADATGDGSSHDEVLAAGDGEPVVLTGGRDDIAEIVFTSGTTGTVKGVEATHASLLYRDKQPWPSVLLHALPLATTAAQLLMVDAVRGHQTLVLQSAFHPRRFCELAERFAPTWAGLAPAMGAMLVRTGQHERFTLTSVTDVSFVSAPIQPATLGPLRRLFPAATLRNYYSSTEASPAGVGTVVDPDRPTSVGRPDGGSLLRIELPGGAEAGPGQEGEVLLRTPDGAGRRYADDTTASAAVFRDGWVRTGDLGHVDADGYLYLTGRRSDVINTGGHNVSAAEVELVLAEHPDVSEAVVLGLPHEVLGEMVVAVVVPQQPADEPDPASLTRFCLDRLARHKVPRRFVAMADVPRNPIGKPLKRVLRERLTGAAATTEGGHA